MFVDKSGNIVFRCDGEFEKFESGNGYEVFSNGYAYFKIEDKQYILDSAFNLIETKINENSIGLGKYVYSGLVPNKTGGTIVYSFIENNDNGSIIKNYMIGYDGEIKYINTKLNCTDNSTYFDDYIILNNGYVLFGGYNEDKTNKDGNLTLVSNNGEIIFQKNMERKEPFFNCKEKHPNKFTFINDFLCYKDKINNLSMEEINYIDFSLKINSELFKNLNEANINFRDIIINCIGNNKIYVCLARNMVGYNNENGFVNLSSIEKLAIYCEENIKINLEPMSVNTKYIMYENLSSIKIYINNKKINFDVPPIMENDRTLVPMRVIFEALGAEVEWENETQTAW